MASIKSFEEIQAWQQARKLTQQVYSTTNRGKFVRDLALRDQIRRAAISILSNIAEGFERGGNAEFVQFLSIAKGSAGEIKAQLYIALDLGYINTQTFSELDELVTEVIAKSGGLMTYLRNSGMKGSKYK